jgi:UDP-N-acetylmuramate: L-alanyl-gamma-D-glutamyl-meso-diaminopimelate ligase
MQDKPFIPIFLKTLLSLIKGHKLSPKTFEASYFGTQKKDVEGICIPINLSLCESICTLQNLSFPPQSILFIEDVNEYSHTILRKIDSLILSEKIKNVVAIVVGDMSYKEGEDRLNLDLTSIAFKTKLPTIHLPIFGHKDACFPLVMKSRVRLASFQNKTCQVTLSFDMEEDLPSFKNIFSYDTHKKSLFHIMGIGGTATSSLAGLLKQKGYEVKGSDENVYAPIDGVLKKLKVDYKEGYKASHLQKGKPLDYVVIANVISPLSSKLKRNEELDELLENELISTFSLPSCLRHIFLKHSTNILVSGTHGKTTSTAILTHMMQSLKMNPSYLIAGVPQDKETGFALRSLDTFILEADEYDSAFFDKGPKFLHYEPSIAIINNIEFDHADIYDSLKAIEDEFERLLTLIKERQGVAICNYDDPRVRKLAQKVGGNVLYFSKKGPSTAWRLKGYVTTVSGIEVTALSPSGEELTLPTRLFGEHNALNVVACLAALHSYLSLQDIQKKGLDETLRHPFSPLMRNHILEGLKSFKGIKRRFECLYQQEVSVFDDFAHHPTAIKKTLQAFRDYLHETSHTHKRLVVCFDPRNATMRRNIFEKELAESLKLGDLIFLGKVFEDLRIPVSERLNAQNVIKALKPLKAHSYKDNDQLLEDLKKAVRPGDIVVFMSSGSFDQIPYKFVAALKKKE